MCLEEMLACDIPEGALFYQQTKRRERVKFDEDLRNMVEADFLQMHDLLTKPWRKCHYGQLKESCVSRIRVLRLLLWGAAANWAFLWHSIHREVIITVPC